MAAHEDPPPSAAARELDAKLRRALREDRVATVRRLLRREGFPIALRDAQGWAPLHAAALRGQSDMVDLLLDAGADIDARTHDGGTPLECAAWGGRVETVRRLIASGAALPEAGPRALGTAVRKGHVAVVDALLDAGVEPDALIDEQTALTFAIERAQLEIAARLLERGADPRGRGRGSPLVAAIQRDAEALTLRLLEAGADPTAPGRFGTTPMHAAARRGAIAIAARLRARAAPIDPAREGGQTPLQDAAASGQRDMVTWLIEQGAALDAVDGDGRNAFTLAARGGHDDVAALLRRAGVPEQRRFSEDVARARHELRERREQQAAAQERFRCARPGTIVEGAFAKFKGRARPAAARGGARQLEVQIALFGRTTEVTIPASAFHYEDGGTAIGLTAGDVFEFRESTGCGSTTIRFVALESARAELTLRADWMGSDALELRARGRLGFAEHGQVGWLRVEELTGRLGERGEPLRVTAFAERDPTLEFVLVPPTPNWAAAGSGMDVTPSARFNLEWELVLWEQPMARCFPDEDALEDELVARIEARRGAEGDDLYDARDEAKATVEATKTLCERAFEHLRLVRFARARPSPGPSDEPWPGYYKYKHKHEAAEDREDGEDEVDDERDAE